jgi:hypothetical protein
MGIATALVVIGGSHQNDTGISPQVIAELWEGDRANWSVRSIGSKDIEFRVDPNSPDDIFDELVNVLRKVCGISPNEPLKTSIAVTIFDDSSLESRAHRFAELSTCDVSLFTSAYSRTFSAWKDEWITKGSLKI